MIEADRATIDPMERPSTDAQAVILDHCDITWAQLRDRLEGLDDHEYLWEPTENAWSVRRQPDGRVIVDGFEQRDLDPAPVTTIAWRIWHIGVDCLDAYSARFLGRTGAKASDDSSFLTAAEGLSDLDAAWANFRSGMGTLTTEEWWTPLGDAFDGFSQHSPCDLMLHANREVTHHGAEIALLRDLYRARST